MSNFSKWIDAVIDDSNRLYAQPDCGMFTLYFDNSKRRGLGRTVQHCEAEGVLYSSGHVHLDTQDVPIRDFLSLQQMMDQFDIWGKYTLEWHKDGKP